MSVFRSLLLSSALLTSLSACGSVMNGSALTGNSQVIYVNALPNNNKATSCTLENERGSWNAPFLPSSVSVSRANGLLTVTCNSVDGFHGSVSAKSDTSGSLAKGYPDSIVVPMSPTRPQLPEASQGFPYRTSPTVPSVSTYTKPVYQHHKTSPAPVPPSRGNS